MGTTVKQPAPDPAIGEASKESIELARDQFNAQQALVSEFSPLYREQIEFNLAQQQKYADRADDSLAQYDTYFKPLEQQFATTAANYNTQGRRDQAANEASAGVASQFGTARQSLDENIAAQNIQGAAAASLRGSLGIQEAKARAAAGDTARRDTEKTGLSLLSAGANFGRGMPAQGLQFGQAAAGSGGAAQGNVAGLSGITGAGYNQALQGYGVGINGLLGQYQARQSSANASAGIFGDLLGAGLTAYGMYASSKELKTGKQPISGKAALAGLSDLPVESWRYKKGEGDGGEHVGPYAEDVNKRFGDTVAPGGKAIDMVEMNDVTSKAMRELAKQVAELTREVADLEAA